MAGKKKKPPKVAHEIKVTVSYVPTYGRGTTTTVNLAAGATVRDALAAAKLPTETSRCNVFMAQPAPVELDQALTDGAKISVAERPTGS